MGLPGWRRSPVNCWSTGWLWFVVIWVLRTACTDLRISKDGDPTARLFLSLHSPRKNLPYFLFTCPAVKTAVKPPPCWDVSFSIFWHMCGPRPSHCAGSRWAWSCFPLWYQGAYSWTQHIRSSLTQNVKLKEIISCAHLTQMRSSVCDQVPETLVAIIRDL